MTDTETLRKLVSEVTPGPWRIVPYDAGDKDEWSIYTPLIDGSEEADRAVVHWAGFRQKYWQSADGKQSEIEANARLIAMSPELALELIEARERLAALTPSLAAQAEPVVFRYGIDNNPLAQGWTVSLGEQMVYHRTGGTTVLFGLEEGIRKLIAHPPAPQPDLAAQAQLKALREALEEFRNHVIHGCMTGTITRAGEHHEPIWAKVAAALASVTAAQEEA